MDFPGADWVLIDGKEEVLPGTTVFPAPGHTAGHQSVLVRSHDQIEVIAAQAVYDPGVLEAEASIEPLIDAEADQTAASAQKIKAVDPGRVFFSHDTRIWQPAGDQGD